MGIKLFTLHPQLQQDCIPLGFMTLSQVLLMNDAHYPWCVLVPRRNNIREIYELSSEDQLQLTRESSVLTRAMATYFNADKMNIAALGNLVPQLHIHHIARFTTDPAWPAPVWGKTLAKPYEKENLAKLLSDLKNIL